MSVAADGTATNVAGGVSSISCALTTTHAGDYVLVFVSAAGAGSATATCAGLSFTQLLYSPGYNNAAVWVFGAPASAVLSSASLTVTFSASVSSVVIAAVAFSGVFIPSPFDPDASLPVIVDDSGGQTSTFTGISTNDAPDGLIWFMGGNDDLTNFVGGAGWTQLINYIPGAPTRQTLSVGLKQLSSATSNQTYTPTGTIPTDASGMLALTGFPNPRYLPRMLGSII